MNNKALVCPTIIINTHESKVAQILLVEPHQFNLLFLENNPNIIGA